MTEADIERMALERGGTVVRCGPIIRHINDPVPKPVSEKRFQAMVVEYAKERGWLVYHTYRSDRSEKGFPDLVLCRLQRVVFSELKAEHGKATNEQKTWLDTLEKTGQVGVYLWRPSDWPTIVEVLK